MLGRATRLCQEIGKTHFEIFDAVSVYESLEPVSDMKPVIFNPAETLEHFKKLTAKTPDNFIGEVENLPSLPFENF